MSKVVVVSDQGVKTIKTDEERTKENEEFEKILSVKKENDMMVLVDDLKKDRSLRFGVVGSGQCGGRLATQFYKLGYPTVVMNTALQDLETLDIPSNKKLYLDISLGGSAKDLSTGAGAIETYPEEILNMIKDNLSDTDILMLVTSGGGGSGSGSAEGLVRLMNQTGKPVVVLYVLPFSTEDTLCKHNAVVTLSKLAKMASTDEISSLMIVDNSRIQMLYPNLSIGKIFPVANEAIVTPLHLFNMLSSKPSDYQSLDPTDFAKIFLDRADCCTYGMISVGDYLQEDAIATAIVTNLQGGLLAGQFDLAQTRSCGVIITASKETLDAIPSANLEFGFAMLERVCSPGTQVFRGIYAVEGQEDLRVYCLFSGLGLPEARIEELKAEAEKHMEMLKNKEDKRAANMMINIGKTETTSAVDLLHKKIQNKNSALGKLQKNRVVDKRRTS